MEIKQLFLNSGYRPFCLFFIVDDSASMQGYENKVEKGFMGLIESLRKHPLFSDSYLRVRYLHERQEIASPLENLKSFTLHANGGSTPLYDRIGESLTELSSYQTAVEDRGYKYRAFFGVLTDGQDNASDTFSRDEIVARIRKLRDEGLVAFIGIDLGNINSAFYTDAGFKLVKDSKDLDLMFKEVHDYLLSEIAGLLPPGTGVNAPSVIVV
jgi:uncharacterized protein YegL